MRIEHELNLFVTYDKRIRYQFEELCVYIKDEIGSYDKENQSADIDRC